jgi:trimethylamine--corrinoid protein Co-methyltransferase
MNLFADPEMTEQSNRKGLRPGAGRKARTEKRLSDGTSHAIRPGMQGGQYRPLSEEGMGKIHNGALEILATTGIGEPLPELLDIVLPLGCYLNDHGRLCFPKAMPTAFLHQARW